MKVHLTQTMSHLQLCLIIMKDRRVRVERSAVGLLLRQHRLMHTDMAIALLEELLGMMHQDPDKWEDEPDLVPF